MPTSEKFVLRFSTNGGPSLPHRNPPTFNTSWPPSVDLRDPSYSIAKPATLRPSPSPHEENNAQSSANSTETFEDSTSRPRSLFSLQHNERAGEAAATAPSRPSLASPKVTANPVPEATKRMIRLARDRSSDAPHDFLNYIPTRPPFPQVSESREEAAESARSSPPIDTLHDESVCRSPSPGAPYPPRHLQAFLFPGTSHPNMSGNDDTIPAELDSSRPSTPVGDLSLTEVSLESLLRPRLTRRRPRFSRRSESVSSVATTSTTATATTTSTEATTVSSAGSGGSHKWEPLVHVASLEALGSAPSEST